MASDKKEQEDIEKEKESVETQQSKSDNKADEKKADKSKEKDKKADKKKTHKKEKAKIEKEKQKKKEELEKKEKLEERRRLVEAKKQIAAEEKARKKYKKLLKLPEPSQQILRAVGGGLLGVLAQVALTYILWGIADQDSILYAGFMIDVSSMGNPFNALTGVWTFSFTPLTVLDKIMINWISIWYYFFIPIIVAGLVVGITGKRMLTCLLGGLFFIFWGIVIPVIMAGVLSVFGVIEPALIDGFLLPMLNEPMNGWNYDWLYNLSNNIFISWTIAGALEIGLLVTVIAFPIGALIQLIK